MTDEIPADIPQDVWDHAWDLWCDEGADEGPTIIARAILAERERCAKVAAELPVSELQSIGEDNPKLTWRLAAIVQRDAIVSAIAKAGGRS